MEELDLKELFNIFWNKKVQIILIVLIFAVIGVIYTMGFITPVYTSSTTLVLATSSRENQGTTNTTNSITTSDITLNSNLVSTYSVLVRSKDVLGQVISNLGIDISWEDLKNNVTVSSVEDTEVLEIAVTNGNPQSNENNDWEMMGKDIQKLQTLIDSLEKMREEENKNNTNNTTTANDVNEIRNSTDIVNNTNVVE